MRALPNTPIGCLLDEHGHTLPLYAGRVAVLGPVRLAPAWDERDTALVCVLPPGARDVEVGGRRRGGAFVLPLGGQVRVDRTLWRFEAAATVEVEGATTCWFCRASLPSGRARVVTAAPVANRPLCDPCAAAFAGREP